jgi:nucleoside-diphosphate-sugar epimerase
MLSDNKRSQKQGEIMKVFVTGATGFIGSALVPELIKHGHTVVGLTRSEEGAEKLKAAGAEPLHGTIEELDILRKGAKEADGVIHLAFIHDFSKFLENVEKDGAAIRAIAEVLQGTQKPFLMTSGTAIAGNADGRPSTEDGEITSRNPRAQSEVLVKELVKQGINLGVVRLPQVHDPYKQGLTPYVTAVAKEKGVSVYIGDGANRWPAAAVNSVAELYRLALEKAEPGLIVHAVDEEGVSMKEIAEAIGRRINVPVKSIPATEAEAHFGWLAMFVGHDMPSSSAITQKKLNWKPYGPGLIEDLDAVKE